MYEVCVSVMVHLVNKYLVLFLSFYFEGFDWFTNYTDRVGVMTEQQWLNRIVFLETVAGVPGFVGGMARHMRSLRFMRRDNGWIRTLLEEGTVVHGLFLRQFYEGLMIKNAPFRISS
jgi:hypothetical protein